jgi:membrane protease YdiL (CAAX protease family)
VASAASSLFSGEPAYEPQTGWPAVWAVLATLLIYGAGVVALSGLISLDGILRGLGAAQGLWRRDSATLLTIGAWQLVTIGLTIAASRLFAGKISEVLALGAPAGGPATFAVAIPLTVVLQAILWFIGLWLMPESSDTRPPATLFGEQWWLALLVIGLGAPLSEELLFRGFLLSALAKTPLGFWAAAVIATIWWTFLHAGASATAFIPVFLMGLLYSWQLRRSGSLWVPIVCHAVYNIVIILVFGQLKV